MGETQEKTKLHKTECARSKYSLLSNILYFYRYAYREFPRLAGYHAVTTLGRIFLPFFGILMPGIVLHMVEAGELLWGLAVIALAGSLMLACDSLVAQAEGKTYFQENLFRISVLNDIVLKQMKLSLLNYGILQKKNKWQLALREEFAQSDREINYLNQAFQDKRMAKDVRVFAMNDWLMAFRGKLLKDRMGLEKRKNRRIIAADSMQLLLNLLRNGFAYAYLIYACLRGEISAASFLVYFGAITGFSDFVTTIVDLYSGLKLSNADAVCLRIHMDLPETDDSWPERLGETDRKKALEALSVQPAKIEFRDVSFSYGEQKIYEHFNLVIRPGEKVALLGVNGAGKTTLVKLLCGLYEPDEGEILINDIDTASLPRRTLYDIFSVVFQETAIFPYPVGCNLSLKKLEETDEEWAWEALRGAGLEELFRERGIGLDSFMTTTAFKGGVELSGGQTQRFLLARALYRNGNILILDEPTSALDPIAESQIYQEYVNISRGRTSLFISHRLASTKFSDRILFLENGRIKEEGTHEELMALGGSYAHMFEVQSHYYVAGDDGLRAEMEG